MTKSVSSTGAPLPDLNLPPYAFEISNLSAGRTIYDPVRRRQLPLTPEEWVRQNVVQFLLQERGCPAALTSLEYAFQFEGRQKRVDIVIYGRSGNPLILVECKAVTVPIRQGVFDQIARYNQAVNARVLVVTNGLSHYCYTVEQPDPLDSGETDIRYKFLDDMPHYGSIIESE